jgi:membrane dipeptidase
MRALLQEMRAKYHDREARAKAMEDWFKTEGAKLARGTYCEVADHIDHIVKVAGIDNTGIGSDFDGISMSPVGLEDVSSYPRLTEELLRRGYSEADVHKILGGNALRAFRQAGEVAQRLRATVPPEVDEIKAERRGY